MYRYEIPVSVNAREVRDVSLLVDPADGQERRRVIAFCDPNGKAVVVKAGGVAKHAARTDAAGALHVLKLVPRDRRLL